MKQVMKSFLGKLSTRKWMFAFAIYVVCYALAMLGIYNEQVKLGNNIYLHAYYSRDMSSNLAEPYEMEPYGFHYWYVTYRLLFKAFIPYLIIGAYYFDYKNELHPGWARAYVTAQIMIPILVALYMVENQRDIFDFILSYIIFFGLAEAVVLILIKLSIWIRAGFTKPAS